MKPTQTPTACNSFPVNLTLDELETIVLALESLTDYTPIYNKLKFLLPIPNIGDACRHSAHIPEAPGQGGTNSDLPLVGSDSLPMVEYYQDQIETYGFGQGGNHD